MLVFYLFRVACRSCPACPRQRPQFLSCSCAIAGIMYTSMPRAELVGTARFVDAKNRLCCEVTFGKVADQADEPLLQRSDSFSGVLFQFSPSSSHSLNGGHNVSPAAPHPLAAPPCRGPQQPSLPLHSWHLQQAPAEWPAA